MKAILATSSLLLATGCQTYDWSQYRPMSQDQSQALIAYSAALLQAGGPKSLAPPTAAPSPPMPGVMMGFLKTQQVNGFLRYCTYSNGVVLTVQSVDLCPMQSN